MALWLVDDDTLGQQVRHTTFISFFVRRIFAYAKRNEKMNPFFIVSSQVLQSYDLDFTKGLFRIKTLRPPLAAF